MLLALLTGCGSLETLEDTGGTKKPNKYAQDASVEIVPEAGKWVYQNLTVQSKRCMALEEILPFEEGEHFKIFQINSRGFSKKLPGIDDSTRCQLNGSGFSCDSIRGTPTIEDQDLNLISDLNALGVFVDSTRAKGR